MLCNMSMKLNSCLWFPLKSFTPVLWKVTNIDEHCVFLIVTIVFNFDLVFFHFLIPLSAVSWFLKTKPTAPPASQMDPLRRGTSPACLKCSCQSWDCLWSRGTIGGCLELNRCHNMWSVVLVWDQWLKRLFLWIMCKVSVIWKTETTTH